MRKFLMSLSAAGMLIVAPAALPSAATAAPNPGLEFCREVIGPAPQPRNLGILGQCTCLSRSSTRRMVDAKSNAKSLCQSEPR